MDSFAGLAHAVAGVYALTSPVALSTVDLTGEGKVVAAMVTLGALVAISSIVSLARPNLRAAEWGTTLFGVLLFVAPWVVGYAALTGPAWTSWLVGAFTVVVSQTVVRPFNRGPRRAAQN